jgi:hypothetical protein
MKLLNKLKKIFTGQKKSPLTWLQKSDMEFWEVHKDDFPPMQDTVEILDAVWFMGSNSTPIQGVIIEEKSKKGKLGWLLQYGADNTHKWVPRDEPMFYNREDLLLYNIGLQWKEINRLLRGLESAGKNAAVVQEYTERRVAGCKNAIENYRSKMVLMTPENVAKEPSDG